MIKWREIKKTNKNKKPGYAEIPTETANMVSDNEEMMKDLTSRQP